MALKTNVNIKYRTAYQPKVEIPDEQLKIMKHEISLMRKDLIEKQEALQRSKEFESDERLYTGLKNLKVNDLKTTKNIWTQWSRLSALEQSNTTSVTGKREIRRKTVETFNMKGYEFVTQANIKDLGRLFEMYRNSYAEHIYSSSEVVLAFEERNGQITDIEDLILAIGEIDSDLD